MARWVTFDETTRTELDRAVGAESDLRAGGALDAALAADRAVAVLPAPEDGGALLITLSRRIQVHPQPSAPKAEAAPTAARWEDPDAVGYSASGFLGLLDAPVYEDEEEQKPKSWWRKIVG